VDSPPHILCLIVQACGASERAVTESIFLTYRRATIVGVHIVLWTVAFLGAFLLRWEFAIPDRYFPELWSWAAVLVALRCGTGVMFGIFHGMWRYTGANDLVGLLKATSLSSLAFATFILGLRIDYFPRSIFIIEWLASMMLVGGLRFGIRKLREIGGEIRAKQGRRSRILILGAGDAGESLVREIQRNAKTKYIPVGFLDDDPRKRGMEIHGLKVLGPIADVAETTAHQEVDEIIIAIPTASGAEVRAILERTKPLHAQVRTIPGVDQLLDGRVTVNQIREVAIEDLLGRDPVDLEETTIADAIKGSVVVVSGAGGSIGSELCRQLCRHLPRQLVLVERTENNLFLVHRELRQSHPEVDLVPCVCDVSDVGRVDAVFTRYGPEVVFHAAAHKHVPMMEWNPGEAIKNNVRGTRIFAEAADRHGAARFVMVSTDKAVNPTSVMGVSKRAAEIFVQNLGRHSSTRTSRVESRKTHCFRPLSKPARRRATASQTTITANARKASALSNARSGRAVAGPRRMPTCVPRWPVRTAPLFAASWTGSRSRRAGRVGCACPMERF
jgi:FlaA1/EpsC-like NDP-sugar epimerase